MLVIAGGFLVHLSLGSFYTFANIAPYMASYIRNQSHPADLHQTATSWIYACIIAGMGCTAWFGGWLSNKLGPRLTTLLGGWTMSAGVLLTYFAIQVSFWLVLLTYGVMFGVGMGVAYTAPLAVAMRWMPKWKGVASGFVVSGFGLGALVFSPVQTLYVNPLNIPPIPDPSDENQKHFTDADLLGRVPSMFLILGVTFAMMQFLGIILITNPPPGYVSEPSQVKNKKETDIVKVEIHEVDDVQLLQYCEKNRNVMMISEKHASSSTPNEKAQLIKSQCSSSPVENGQDLQSSSCSSTSFIVSDSGDKEKLLHHEDQNNKVEPSSVVMVSLHPLQVLRKRNFYILWFTFLCNGVASVFISANYKFFGNSFIHDDHFLAAVVSVSSIFNCLGRISWGLVADRTSYRFAIVIISATLAVFTLTFYSSVVGGEAMFLIWVCIIFSCIGGNFSVFPMAMARTYGLDYVAANYGMMYTSQIIAGVLGATVSSTLIAHIGYHGLLFFVGGFSCIGFLSMLIYRAKIYLLKQF